MYKQSVLIGRGKRMWLVRLQDRFKFLLTTEFGLFSVSLLVLKTDLKITIGLT